MILERLLSKNPAISGPLTACLAIQNGSFQNLANGSKVPREEVTR
jgi:hypothetical protein